MTTSIVPSMSSINMLTSSDEVWQSRDYRDLIKEKKLQKKLEKKLEKDGKSLRLRRPSKLRSSLLTSSSSLLNLEEDECVKVVAEKSATEQPNKCPFGHGTVYSSPYPGYVHGNKKRGICPNGCRPIVDSELLEKEGSEQTVMREALEFLELYYKERQAEMAKMEGFLSKSERVDQVKTSIETTGTYTHTFDELQHGARVAWRSK